MPDQAIRDKKAQIIAHVYEVFYRNGFHAAGLDLLLEGSGISKRTLYKYFASKEALIAETVRHYGQLFREAMKQRLRGRRHSPLESVLALFEVQQELVSAHQFQGCYAVKAMLEYDHHDAVILQATQEIYDELSAFFEQACQKMGLADPQLRSQQILILFRGAAVSSQACKSAQPYQMAREAVITLCAAA